MRPRKEATPMIRRTILPALLLLLAWPAAATELPAAATELPVRGVTLSSAGLAQIIRGGTVGPDASSLTFRVPLADVDDILRSLVVADPAGRVEGVRLPAQDLATEAFRGLPVRPEDFSSRASLFNALRGQRVALGSIEGRIAAHIARCVVKLALHLVVFHRGKEERGGYLTGGGGGGGGLVIQRRGERLVAVASDASTHAIRRRLARFPCIKRRSAIRGVSDILAAGGGLTE
jgi:hypothetical protein